MPEPTAHPWKLVAGLAVLLAAMAPPIAAKKLAVLTDGRILRVEDAKVDGDRIVLLLGNEASLELAPTRLDRVIDARPASPAQPPPQRPVCEPSWADEPLPPGTPYAEEIANAARTADIHPWLLAALVQAESAFDPRALSRVGAAGLTQLMPATAADYGVADVWDPTENLRGGAEHLKTLLKRFSAVHLALAAYNAGAATVEAAGGVPPYAETRGFVRRVVAVFCPDGHHGSAGGRRDPIEGGEEACAQP